MDIAVRSFKYWQQGWRSCNFWKKVVTFAGKFENCYFCH